MNSSPNPSDFRQGYTLLEVMLVVMIIGLAGVLVISVQRNAMKNARLRDAARTVQVLNQHARNTAILKQQHVQVRYDNAQSIVEVIALNNRQQRQQNQQIALGIEIAGADTLKYDEDESAQDREDRHNATSTTTITKRKLPIGIEVTEFESETDLFEDDVYRVDYWPTGYAQGHSLILEDPKRSEEQGVVRRVMITVENITGDIKVEKLDD